MTDLTTDALKRLASEITPGEWTVTYNRNNLEICEVLGADDCLVCGDTSSYDDARAIALVPALLRELIEWREADVWQPTHRHVKRGTEYREVARGKLQTDVPMTDYAELVAYHDQDGNWWFRAPSEFDDGRFAPTEGVKP